MGTVRVRRMLTIVTAGLAVVGVAGCGGNDEAAPTTTEPVTLTTEVDAEPVALGEQILVVAVARDAVVPGEGAEERLVELGSNWCTTALRSDVPNADATFRYSLNDFFTEWGLVSAAGEVQDVPLGRAMLVGTYAEPLAQASNEVLCPEVERQDG
jgi:hypothetical protein